MLQPPNATPRCGILLFLHPLINTQEIIPKMIHNLTKEEIDTLANKMTPDDVSLLASVLLDTKNHRLKEKIASFVDDPQAIFKDMTTRGFYESQVEINEVLKVTFRTSPAFVKDEISRKASMLVSNDEPQSVYLSIVSKLELSASLIKLGDNNLVPGTSISTYIGVGTSIKEAMSSYIDAAFSAVDMLDEILINIIHQHFIQWKLIVKEKISGIDGELVKN